MDPYVGRQIGQYELRGLIGQGGMAVVYRANQIGMNRDVAVKIVSRLLTQDPLFRQRFEREVSMVSQLEHSHIVPVFEHGTDPDGTTYLAMRYIRGGSLADRLRGAPLPFSQIREWLRQVASALDYAHDRKVIHRDIKPANILLDEQNNAYLVDFGLARMVEMDDDRAYKAENLTKTGSFIGTPAYMSPEQIKQERLDARSDVYSLGVVLYEMISGHLPFETDSTFRMMQAHLVDQPTPLNEYRPDISPDIEHIVSRALSKDPAARFQSAGALADAFSQAVDSLTTTQRLAGSYTSQVTQQRRGRLMVVGLLALVLLLVIGGGVVLVSTLSQPAKVVAVNRPDIGTVDDLHLTNQETSSAVDLFKGSFLGIVACTLDTDYHASLVASARTRAQQLGIPVQVVDSKTDPLTQSRLITQLIAQGAKALVICPLDDTAIKDALVNAAQANIPVAEVGNGIPPSGVSISSITDEDIGNAVGSYAAQVVKTELGGKATVAILGYPDLPGLVVRADTMKRALLAAAPNVTVLMPDPVADASGTLQPPPSAWKGGTAEFGQVSMQQILQKHPEVNLLMSINDAGAFGAVTALKAAGRGPNDVLIVSVDADPNAVKMIQAGQYFRGSITTSPIPAARYAVQAVVKLLSGDPVPKRVPLTAQMITKDNAASVINSYNITPAATSAATADSATDSPTVAATDAPTAAP